MLNQTSFIDCIVEQLAERGFGKGTSNAMVARFKSLQAGFEASGHNVAEAATLASERLFSQLAEEKKERAKRTFKTLAVQVANNERVTQALNADPSSFPGMDVGGRLARAAVSLIEDDPRFKGTSYSTAKETVRGQLWALMGDVLEKAGKGAFGVQRGAAHLPNVVRELFGANTGDAVARELAQAYTKTQNVAVDLFNAAGGSMRKLADFRLPQAQNAAKLIKEGFEKWRDVHMKALDWDKMRWPDGSPIDPASREDVLRNVYDTLSTNGASKINPASMRGQGHAVGNALEQRRFLVYKDADAWLQVHEQFGDGNVFDVMAHHVEDMSHKIALVETFGPNPELARQNLHAVVRKHAAEAGGGKAVAEAEGVMKNKFDRMFETVTRENPMDPNSVMGALVTGTANILTSAQLGSAAFLAIPGDFMQTVAVRALNKQGLFGGVDFYLKSLATDREFMRTIAAQSGFVMDEAVAATYAAQRFTGVNTYGPAVTRRLADWTMRASLLSGHTRAARWSVQAEFMGLMARNADMAFDDLPYKAVMERYGIAAAEWDVFRQNVTPWTPRDDVRFLRPIDILDSNVKGKETLYRKMQGMVFEESRKMVPEATIEGATTLRDTTRPDTLAGAVLYSFSMYKNFPVSFMMIYGRLALAQPDKLTRIGFAAGLGVGMTLVGALGVQMREIAKGRDPLPMDNPAFLGKAFLSGGALGIWGDFLFNGINEYGRGPEQAVAGPLFGLLGDTTQLAFGEALERIGDGGLANEAFGSNTASRAVEWARRYTPGTSVWWARAALERQVFDRLQELADPRAYQKRQRKMQKQKREYGNDSFWAPGERTPSRAPNFGGLVE